MHIDSFKIPKPLLSLFIDRRKTSDCPNLNESQSQTHQPWDEHINQVHDILSDILVKFSDSNLYSDSVLCDILTSNSLHKLESFKCARSKALTLKSVSLLMQSCPLLRSCQDLEYWEAVSQEELDLFRESIRRQNIDLKTSDEKEVDLDSAGGLCTTAHLAESVCNEN